MEAFFKRPWKRVADFCSLHLTKAEAPHSRTMACVCISCKYWQLCNAISQARKLRIGEDLQGFTATFITLRWFLKSLFLLLDHIPTVILTATLMRVSIALEHIFFKGRENKLDFIGCYKINQGDISTGHSNRNNVSLIFICYQIQSMQYFQSKII